jgi:uncharacterized protein YjbI with pentapeptide repeats
VRNAGNVQAKATKDAANVDKPAAETLSSSSLLAKKLIDSKEENINDIQGKLIKADLFTTLRNLDGKGKGHLIRFLHEGGFIKVKKQEVSDKQEISLSGANLIKIDLENAWLPDINLKGAYISAGNLSQTSLKRANLIEAKLNGADLTGADLTDADLTNADLTDAKYNDSTTFPNGFKPDEEGMKYMKYCTNPIQCNS